MQSERNVNTALVYAIGFVIRSSEVRLVGRAPCSSPQFASTDSYPTSNTVASQVFYLLGSNRMSKVRHLCLHGDPGAEDPGYCFRGTVPPLSTVPLAGIQPQLQEALRLSPAPGWGGPPVAPTVVAAMIVGDFI